MDIEFLGGLFAFSCRDAYIFLVIKEDQKKKIEEEEVDN